MSRIEVLRRVDAHEVTIVGLVDLEQVVFRATIRRLASLDYVGYDLEYPIVEVKWLEVRPEHRSLDIVFRALCESIRTAVDLADGDRCLLAIDPLHETLRDRLIRRKEFSFVGSSPFPVVARLDDAAALAAKICR